MSHGHLDPKFLEPYTKTVGVTSAYVNEKFTYG